MSSGGDRTLLVDASAFITLAGVGRIPALLGAEGDIVVPEPVANEITNDPAASALSSALDHGTIETWDVGLAPVRIAADHLGKDLTEDDLTGRGRAKVEGDIGLLALALERDGSTFALDSPVVVTDDKPLRRTCKALSVPVSGSIGVLVRAVERGDLAPDDAKDGLLAMDEVGARLSASLLRRAETLIDDAAPD